MKINLEFLSKILFNNEFSIVSPKLNHRYVALESPSVCNKVFQTSFVGDTKLITSKIIDIFDCCDLIEKQYKEVGLFDEFESAIRSNQKIHCMQRASEVMTASGYSHDEKKKIINDLINLIEVKYGDVCEDEIYKS